MLKANKLGLEIIDFGRMISKPIKSAIQTVVIGGIAASVAFLLAKLIG
jgi:hypothetical protein